MPSFRGIPLIICKHRDLELPLLVLQQGDWFCRTLLGDKSYLYPEGEAETNVATMWHAANIPGEIKWYVKGTSSCAMSGDATPVPDCSPNLDAVTGKCQHCEQTFKIRVPECFTRQLHSTLDAFINTDKREPSEARKSIEKHLVCNLHTWDTLLDLSASKGHLRLTFPEERQADSRRIVVKLPSPNGEQKLQMSTLARKEFAERCFLYTAHGVCDGQDYPNWKPNGSDEEFEAWTKQIGNVREGD